MEGATSSNELRKPSITTFLTPFMMSGTLFYTAFIILSK